MAERRRYTKRQKDDAVVLLGEVGLAETWRQTGISKPTLSLWGKEAGLTFDTTKTRAATEQHAERAKELRAQLRLMLLEKAVDVLERMDAPHVEFKGKDADMVTYPIAPAGAVQNYATSAAILIDKYRLEAGEATTRGEFTDLTHDDHERAALRDAIQRELAERSADRAAEARPAEPAVEGAGS